MSIKEIISAGSNVSFTITALDLKEFLMELVQEQEENKKETCIPETYVTADEATTMLGVNVSTLWRWDKMGYLPKVKLGKSVRYRMSDIKKIMER